MVSTNQGVLDTILDRMPQKLILYKQMNIADVQPKR